MLQDITRKQQEALRLYNQGFTRRQAANAMGVSENTYAWYLRKIRDQFNIRTRREMLALEDSLRA